MLTKRQEGNVNLLDLLQTIVVVVVVERWSDEKDQFWSEARCEEWKAAVPPSEPTKFPS